MEERLKLLASAPSAIDDPHIHDVATYLSKRQETALRLIAAVDALQERSPSVHDAVVLRRRRDALKAEVDTLHTAMRVNEERETLLDAAAVLGEGAPSTTPYLRRVLAYLEAKTSIALKVIACLDNDLESLPQGLSEARSALVRRRKQLVEEVDELAAKADAQRRGEVDLRACGLSATDDDPYHVKVTTYLQSRSDMALQLIASLDAKLSDIGISGDTSEEVLALASKRDLLRHEADATLKALDDQCRGQDLLTDLGIKYPTAVQ